MASLSATGPIARAKIAGAADALLAATAVSLPWSTSATSILLVLWVLALVPTLNWTDVRRELLTTAGGLPVLLFLLGVIGMAWADVSLAERWNGLDSFFKLLAIPLLLLQFRRSDRGLWVLGGYLASCILLLLATAVARVLPPSLAIPLNPDGLLVKNAATQSGEFVTCIFGLLFLATGAIERRHWLLLAGALAAALGMLADMLYIATGRTALVIIPVLLVLFAAKRLNRRGIAALFAGVLALGAGAWFSSPYLRERASAAWVDFYTYQATDARNSSGERVEFAKKSIEFILQAPVLGHGTGSIHALFEKSSAGKTGAQGSATTNPHNQTFAVAIQIGLVGALILWAMWIAHLRLFLGAKYLHEWVGLVVVVQNIVGSALNSHLFDFAQGWVYVVGVGVAGGMILKDNGKSSGVAP